jgi:uncharacterized membrane protein HdeD (DUF308 family)
MGNNDSLNFAEKKPLPTAINVLTILTFIGCGLGLLGSLFSKQLMEFGLNVLQKQAESGDATSKQIEAYQKTKEAYALLSQHYTINLIIGLAGIVLCFLGALWMRKLKKDGYWLYLAGEVLPIVAGFIIVGTGGMVDWKSYIGLLIPALFIIL